MSNMVAGTSRTLYLGVQQYVEALPRATFQDRLYTVYWRLIYLTRRVVRFRTFYAKNGESTGVLVFSTATPTSRCVRHLLYLKGYGVTDQTCTRDSCFTCRPESNLRVGAEGITNRVADFGTRHARAIRPKNTASKPSRS